ncbi:signal peptidase I [Bacillus sp. FJAT-42376]|uniref:signal peptidase I n=1 Tax=Bacillus sp. FJAT-42376 TaxID=2014076 RepID=UPI000F516200|nr:signal peptidase I [Bacillus sp. FJAT-42376]AZB43570.1 signal peptidase I [Bacillus sp. FJAT-42376]
MLKIVQKYALRFTLLIGILFYLLLLGNTHQFLPFQLKNVLSGSMEPVFKTGSMILIKKRNNADVYEKGDIITFKTKEKILVTHRIYEVLNENKYKTKGDANDAPDRETVERKNIVGSYTNLTIPSAGYLFASIQSNISLLILLNLPGIVLLFLSYRLLFRQTEKQIKTD